MKKLVLFVSFLFIASLCFGDVILSELCDPRYDYSTDRFIEFCNTGDTPVDLTGWSVVAVGNGSDIFTWNLSGSIAAGDALVCGDATTTTSFTVDFPEEDWSSNNSTWNGKEGDGAKLYDDSKALLDYAVVDATTFENKDLNRNGDILSPNTSYVASEWTATACEYATDASPGSHSFGGSASIVYAYAVSNDAIEVFYNQDMTTVDPSDFELTGSATITFSTAIIDGSDATIVHLSGASTPMADDNILDTISDEAKSTYDFYAGITSIAYTNAFNPGGTIDDTHIATFKGIISANDEYNNVWISDAAGAYNGVLIFDYNFYALVDVGDEVLITANRTTYNSVTELIGPSLISTLSTGNTPYGPTVINGSDIEETIGVDTNPAESYEGQLCQIDTMTVVSYTDYDYRCSWEEPTTKTTYYFHVGDNVDYQFGVISLTIGSEYSNIIGLIDWDNDNNYYRINPRDDNDYTLLQDTTPPVISTIIVTDASNLEVYFNENVEETSAETTSNYTISSRDVAVTDAVLDAADATHVTLTVTGMTYGDYTLLAIGVEDLSGNPSDDSHNFSYSSLPEPGDIVINEIMKDPSAVADANGEYFELYNATDHVIDINGWTVRDDGSDSFLIDNGGPLNIPSYGYLVLGNDGDPLTNGGYTCDYAYSGMYLGNSDDELILEFSGTIIDSVYWDGGTTFPDPTGASMELDPAHQNTVDNDNGANWYTAYTPYGDGDDGTPGSANPGPQLPAPIDVSIQINGSDVILNWSSGASKATYNIYRSLNPYDGFSLLDSTSDTTYTDTDAATSEFKYFYYITEE